MTEYICGCGETVTPDHKHYIPFECGHCGERVQTGGACGCVPTSQEAQTSVDAESDKR